MLNRPLIRLLASEPVLRRARRRASPDIVVLMYHELLGPDELAEAWTALRSSDFRRQIEYLKSAFDIISIDEALKRNDTARPAVVLTFDDGGAGNHAHLLPVVRELRLPVTVFVATGHVECGRSYWFDRVVNALQVTAPISLDLRDAGLGVYAVRPPCGDSNWSQIQHLLVDIKKAGLERNEELADLVATRAGGAGGAVRSLLRPMTIEQLRELGACPHVTIGAHSHAHGLLTQMSESATLADVARSRQLLIQWTQQPVEHFAYPSGEYNDRVRRNVMACGFRTAFTTERKLWRAEDDAFAIPRMGIGRYDSAAAFRLALGGGPGSVLRAQF